MVIKDCCDESLEQKNIKEKSTLCRLLPKLHNSVTEPNLRSVGFSFSNVVYMHKHWSYKIDSIEDQLKSTASAFLPLSLWICSVASFLPYIGVLSVCWVYKSTREDSAKVSLTCTGLSIITANNTGSIGEATMRSIGIIYKSVLFQMSVYV